MYGLAGQCETWRCDVHGSRCRNATKTQPGGNDNQPTYQSGPAVALTLEGLLAWRDKLVADSLKVPDQSEIEFYNDYFKKIREEKS